MTVATVAYGLTFATSGSIVGITNLDGPNVDRDMIEITNLSSTGQAKEFLAGLIDAGEVSIDVSYQPQNSTHKAILTALVAASQAAATYTITLTDSGASTIAQSMFVKSFKLKGAVADKLAATFTFKGTGVVTFPV